MAKKSTKSKFKFPVTVTAGGKEYEPGEDVLMDASEAENIHSLFGEYADSGASATTKLEFNEATVLRTRIVELEAQVKSPSKAAETEIGKLKKEASERDFKLSQSYKDEAASQDVIQKLEADAVTSAKEFQELEASVLEATAALDLLFDEVTGAAPKDGVSLVDKITELTELLSSEPDAQDAVKEEGGDNG